MSSSVKMETGIPGSAQESDFMNATLQSAGSDGKEYVYDFSIATFLKPPAHALESENTLAIWIKQTLELACAAPGIARGEMSFEVQVGPFGHGPEETFDNGADDDDDD